MILGKNCKLPSLTAPYLASLSIRLPKSPLDAPKYSLASGVPIRADFRYTVYGTVLTARQNNVTRSKQLKMKPAAGRQLRLDDGAGRCSFRTRPPSPPALHEGRSMAAASCRLDLLPYKYNNQVSKLDIIKLLITYVNRNEYNNGHVKRFRGIEIRSCWST